MKLTTQERIDCGAVAVGIAVLLFLLGMLAAPQPSAAPAPLDSVAVASVDAAPVAVDSESEPSGIAGLTVGELLRDAWTTYQVIPEQAPSGQYTAVAEYSASYGGQPPAYSADHLILESINFPGVFHVFQMIAAQRA